MIAKTSFENFDGPIHLSSIAITSFIYVQYLETSFNYDIRLHIPEQDVPEKGVFAGSVSKKITYAQWTQFV